MISTWIVFSVGLISADGFSIQGIEEIQDVRNPLIEKFGLTNLDTFFSFGDRFGEENFEVLNQKNETKWVQKENTKDEDKKLKLDDITAERLEIGQFGNFGDRKIDDFVNVGVNNNFLLEEVHSKNISRQPSKRERKVKRQMHIKPIVNSPKQQMIFPTTAPNNSRLKTKKHKNKKREHNKVVSVTFSGRKTVPPERESTKQDPETLKGWDIPVDGLKFDTTN